MSLTKNLGVDGDEWVSGQEEYRLVECVKQNTRRAPKGGDGMRGEEVQRQWKVEVCSYWKPEKGPWSYKGDHGKRRMWLQRSRGRVKRKRI